MLRIYIKLLLTCQATTNTIYFRGDFKSEMGILIPGAWGYFLIWGFLSWGLGIFIPGDGGFLKIWGEIRDYSKGFFGFGDFFCGMGYPTEKGTSD